MLLTLTDAAKLYFSNSITNLSKNQSKNLNQKQLNLRLRAISAGTLNANIELYYCPPGEQQQSDLAMDYDNFILYLEKTSEQALTDAIIDYNGKVSIKAPYLKANINLFNKINHFLATDINPVLARHKGLVKLVEVNEDNKEVVLQFGGGCKGCSMVDFTLKQGIEKSLKTQFPEIMLIKDITDHNDGKDAFYK